MTHLTGGPAKPGQATKMKRIVGRHAGRGPTVLGGDWNLSFGGDPDAQDYVPRGMSRKGDRGMQRVLASATFAFVRVRSPGSTGPTIRPYRSI